MLPVVSTVAHMASVVRRTVRRICSIFAERHAATAVASLMIMRRSFSSEAVTATFTLMGRGAKNCVSKSSPPSATGAPSRRTTGTVSITRCSSLRPITTIGCEGRLVKKVSMIVDFRGGIGCRACATAAGLKIFLKFASIFSPIRQRCRCARVW